MVMNLANCSEEDAKKALASSKTIEDAIYSLIEPERPAKRPRIDDGQEFFRKMRRDMEGLDADIAISLSQRALSESGAKIIRPEETAPQNNCSPKCPQSSQELKE